MSIEAFCTKTETENLGQSFLSNTVYRCVCIVVIYTNETRMPFVFFIPNVTFELDSKCSYGGFVKGVLETVAISDLK